MSMCVCVCVYVCVIKKYYTLKINMIIYKIILMIYIFNIKGPSRLGLYNMPTATLQKGKIPQNECADMILNYLIARLRSWSFG